MDDTVGPVALDTATLDQIAAELKARNRAVLVVVLAHPASPGDEVSPIELHSFGGQLTAIGLARYAEQALMGMFSDQEE